jgi:hypothetical protein
MFKPQHVTPAQANLFSYFGSIDQDSHKLAIESFLAVSENSVPVHFTRRETVFEPLESEKAKLNLPRVTMIEHVIEGGKGNVQLRILGRPVTPAQHVCLIRSILQVPLHAEVEAREDHLAMDALIAKNLMTFADYRFGYEFVAKGVCFKIGGSFAMETKRSERRPVSSIGIFGYLPTTLEEDSIPDVKSAKVLNHIELRMYQIYKVKNAFSRKQEDLELIFPDQYMVEVEMIDSSADLNAAESVLKLFNSRVLEPLGLEMSSHANLVPI